MTLSVLFYSDLDFQNTLIFQIFDVDEDDLWNKAELKLFIKHMLNYIIREDELVLIDEINEN